MIKIVDPTVCVDLDDYLSKVDDKVNNGWMFRGQMSDSWSLANKFERVCHRFDVIYADRQRIEDNMIREFRRRFCQYTAYVTSAQSYIESLALMQHHGTLTRYIDFTYLKGV